MRLSVYCCSLSKLIILDQLVSVFFWMLVYLGGNLLYLQGIFSSCSHVCDYFCGVICSCYCPTILSLPCRQLWIVRQVLVTTLLTSATKLL